MANPGWITVQGWSGGSPTLTASTAAVVETGAAMQRVGCGSVGALASGVVLALPLVLVATVLRRRARR